MAKPTILTATGQGNAAIEKAMAAARLGPVSYAPKPSRR
tara:strand:+ start:724 stop:840 length:117 start_codon:yes stop_codon:yes gene_type:complete